MASLPPLGSVAVDVTADLTRLLSGFREANRASQSFDRSINANVARTSAAATRQATLLGGAAQRLARDLRPAALAADRFGSAVTRAGNETQMAGRKIESASASIRRTLLASAATIAAAFGAREIMQLADGYTQFTNRLRSAGLEGQALAEKQEQLLAIANRYGVALGDLGGLFARVSQSQNELGASSAQIMQTVEGAAAAVRLFGASTAEQQGAIRQLSQALGNPVIQMQEMNSLLDGARPLVQAVANGVERFGGSVAKVRQAVMAGNFATREFFEGLQRGLPQIIEDSQRLPLTIGASFQVLNNKLGEYIGQTDRTWSATQRVGGAIRALANDLDTIMPILGLVVAAIGGRYVAALGAATVATAAKVVGEGIAAASATRLAATQGRVTATLGASTIATGAYSGALGTVTLTANAATAGLTRMQVAMAGAAALTRGMGAAILAAFGGWVGLAITGVVAAVYLYYRSVQQAREQVEDFNTHQLQSVEALQSTIQYGNIAAAAVQAVGNRAHTATTYQQEFAGATGDAARALQDQANQARNAAIALHDLQRQRAQEDVTNARGRMAGREPATGTTARYGDIRSTADVEADARDQRMIADAERRIAAHDRELARLRALGLDAFASPNARTQGRDLAAEIVSLQRDLVAANRANNATAQREILKQIRLRQRMSELMQQGISFEVANATAQAEQLRTTRRTSERLAFTAAQADAALRGIGAQIRGSGRPTWIREETRGGPQSQERLYNRYRAGQGALAAVPGTGRHEFRNGAQARDIAKTPGMSLARIRQAIEAAGGQIVELLDEGTHFHVAWRGTARDQAQVAADQLRDQERFQADLQQLQDDLLQAQQEQITDAGQIAVLERQRVTTARDRHRDEINNRLALGQLNETQAAELIAANEALRVQQMRVIDLRETERLEQERHQIATALLETQAEILQFESGMATTAAERRRIDLRMLDVQRQIETLALERVIAAQESTKAERQIAKARLADLDAIYGRRRAETMASTRGPLEEYLHGLPRSVDQVNEALERLKVDQLEDLNRRTMQFADNFAEAFGRAGQAILNLEDPIDVVKALLMDLYRTSMQEFVIRPAQDWIRRQVAGPLAERLVGGQSGPGGLDAATINAAYQAGVLGVTNFAEAINQATVALQNASTGGIQPLGVQADESAAALKSQIPSVNQFGSALDRMVNLLFGGTPGGGAGIGQFIGQFSSLLGSGGGGAGGGSFDYLGALDKMAPGAFGSGGYTGSGSPSDVAGTVHKEEFVFDADDTRRHRPLFDAIRAGRMPSFRAGAGRPGTSSTVNVSVYARDAVLSQTVREWVAEGIVVASRIGATKGAEMALKPFKRRSLP